MTRYIGVLEGSGNNWGVWLPDLPGCVGGGATADLAINDAVSALSKIASLTLAEGGDLPRPRDYLDLRADAEVVDALTNEGALVVIPLLVERGHSVRANISLDAGLLDAIDRAAKARGLTRSAFLASAARDKILAEV